MWNRAAEGAIVPTYQYACTECDHRFDAVQSFSDEALTVCPNCSGRLRKLFGAVGIVFKGSGFSRTDSRPAGSNGDSSSAPKPTEAKSGESKSTDSKSTDSKSSDSKPAGSQSSHPKAGGSKP